MSTEIFLQQFWFQPLNIAAALCILGSRATLRRIAQVIAKKELATLEPLRVSIHAVISLDLQRIMIHIMRSIPEAFKLRPLKAEKLWPRKNWNRLYRKALALEYYWNG